MKIRMTLLLGTSVGYLRRLFASLGVVRKEVHADQAALLSHLYDDLSRKTGTTPQQTEHWYQQRFLPAFVRLLKKGARARQGLVELLSGMREQGIKLAVVSDFSHVSERLRALDIDPGLFDTLRCSEEFGVLKPSPVPMLAVAEGWGIAPANVLVVGDRDDRDGDCARAAGMPFLGITERKNENEHFYCWNDAREEIRARTNLE